MWSCNTEASNGVISSEPQVSPCDIFFRLPDRSGTKAYSLACIPQSALPCRRTGNGIVHLEQLLDLVITARLVCWQYIHTHLKLKSVFNPSYTNSHFIDTFKELVLEDIENININTTQKQNLTKGKKKALKDLQNDRSITYQKLKNDPTVNYQKQLVCLLNKAKEDGILNSNEYNYLKINHPIIPVIYILPKIHKDRNNPPGRPIISGCGSLTSNLSEYIDLFLQKYVINLPSHLKDTIDTIKFLSNISWKKGYILGTLKKYLDEDPSLEKSQKVFLIDSIEFILTKNYFWFENEYYLQTKGTAMGTRFAPSYANLFMGNWENTNILPLLNENMNKNEGLVVWKRYIDDCLFIWNGTQNGLKEFLNGLNLNNQNIHLTSNYSTESVNFLDLTISAENGKLETCLYRKPTDCNGFIIKKSCHHKKWLNSIPYSQFNRIKRNCSKPSDYEKECQILSSQLIDKGYDEKLIQEAKSLCDKKDRKELITHNTAKKHSKNTISFITTYNNSNKELETIIQKHWHILQKDKDLQEHLTKNPQIVYKKPNIIKQILAPSCLPPIDCNRIPKSFLERKNGFFTCRTCKGCKTSKINDRKADKFISNVTKEEFNIKTILTCNSKNIIYLLQCPCNLQYIGRTNRTLKIRIREHMNNIKKGLLTHSVSAHFKTHHNSDPSLLKFMGIAQKKKHWRGNDIVQAISREETYWIHKLKTLTPKCLNIEIDLKCFLME
ncbi:hypothetical protein XELAEV_18017926mg [Xenopus laevis]|uniref:Helix-turn-helix domain-containing protein n=1 Tax=Xenopus laevis TaxID=8355 RepID=A0A974DE41_XENLA|nr:hypothetical protein XELAEV_18017926mg [Xenopus laevis]